MSAVTVETPPEVAGAFAALDKAVAGLGELNFAGLPPAVRLRALDRLETAMRAQRAHSHDIIAGLADADPARIGGALHRVLADSLRISCTEARRRTRDAGQLAARTTFTGEPMPPELPATASAWHDGALDPEHLRVIQEFLRSLPQSTPAPTVEEAERFLVEQATALRPDQLAKVADRYALLLNPDGTFTDADRARQRSFSWSVQRRNGMSTGRLIASPELRANLDAWMARFAAPGMCNPSDETPCVTGESVDTAHNTDLRTPAQRRHDALNALVRSQLGNPQLGVHHGLPVAVIVTTTLKELTDGAGMAVTGGGTLLPMRDVIRMASHAYHYLAVFDDHQSRPLYLGRTRRIASPDQWIVLYARDRGCTAPNCDMPGYHTEAHHMQEWRKDGQTNADELTLACHADHKLMDKGWRTVKRRDGRVEWIPPPQLGLPGATNDFHHPERYLPNGPPDQAA
ncbi:maturase [Mycolicibacter heraklionensis]|uniref:Maturase n=1 Tax=Mycolicibacter heraklionensis TaxID=512402 RepID=A0AA91IZ34_9MYCO|nr:HNH endonuclease signature motif containing protein [Mycolicibacter heraklionensis]OBK87910.1 maturase [Mycolicibacter heraklionensis]